MGRKTALLATVGLGRALAVPAGSLRASGGPSIARGTGQAAEVKRQLPRSWRLVSFLVRDEHGTVLGESRRAS